MEKNYWFTYIVCLQMNIHMHILVFMQVYILLEVQVEKQLSSVPICV